MGWGRGSYTCGNGLAGDRDPRQNRERGGGRRLGRWWPLGVGHRLDPAGGREGVRASLGGVGLEEDRMGTSGRRRTGWGGAEEVAARGVNSWARMVVRRRGRWPGTRAGSRVRMVTGCPGGQATTAACRRTCGPTVAVARCRRRRVAYRHADWRWHATGGRQAAAAKGCRGPVAREQGERK
jgi:hypothetical protein